MSERFLFHYCPGIEDAWWISLEVTTTGRNVGQLQNLYDNWRDLLVSRVWSPGIYSIATGGAAVDQSRPSTRFIYRVLDEMNEDGLAPGGRALLLVNTNQCWTTYITCSATTSADSPPRGHQGKKWKWSSSIDIFYYIVQMKKRNPRTGPCPQ